MCTCCLLQAVGIYGTDVFRRHSGGKFRGADVDTTLWDTIMLTLEGYDKADLQPHADDLHAKLLDLKDNSTFVPKPGEKLGRKNIEARIKAFQKSIDAVIGNQRHADQPRLFPPDLKVGKEAAVQAPATSGCLPCYVTSCIASEYGAPSNDICC